MSANASPIPLLELDPVPTLLSRIRREPAAGIDLSQPARVSRAPGRLDVMGGIADYTGSLVCEMPIDRAAAVVLQPRTDGIVQVFSFNLLDDHRPFTFSMPVESLARLSIEQLRDELKEYGRRWAGYLMGCLFVLHEANYVDLFRDAASGLNLALLSHVPFGAGVSSSAAIEVATMMNLVDHFNLREKVDAMKLAALCQRVENAVVGAPCGIMDQVTCCYGQADALLKLHCQPHDVKGFAKLPPGVRVVGINSNVKHSVGGGMYGKTRCAAFMAHAMILQKMRDIGTTIGRTLAGDPMRGYLANLSSEDYKNLFRPHLPESIRGSEFLSKFGKTIDTATTVDPTIDYHVQPAADHHVLEAMRVNHFVELLQQAEGFSPGSNAESAQDSKQQEDALNKCGHLMYASHHSYTNRALLGADECDLLVDLIRRNEHQGLYGAKITGAGSGGTVAVLCKATPTADAAIEKIMADYQTHTGLTPEKIAGSSPGAWWAGTAGVNPTGRVK